MQLCAAALTTTRCAKLPAAIPTLQNQPKRRDEPLRAYFFITAANAMATAAADITIEIITLLLYHAPFLASNPFACREARTANLSPCS